MDVKKIEILHRDDLPLGGFAGLKEHRLVQSSAVWGPHREALAWEGIGNFVYLADARFFPFGDTGMHPHREVDVISIMVEGRISHGGSLEDGQILEAPQVQVQRAGGEGFEHNETNPDNSKNRLLQLWVMPEQRGMKSGYQLFQPEPRQVTRIYGGDTQQESTFPSKTLIDVAMLEKGQTVTTNRPFLAYLSQGSGVAGGVAVKDGDLMRGESLEFLASEDVQLTVVQYSE